MDEQHAPSPADHTGAHARDALIDAKIAQSWGSSVGEKGYGAPDEASERLYDSLYHPDQVVQGMGARHPDGVAPALRPRTRAVLEEHLDTGPPPDRAQFVRTMSDTIVRDVDVAQTLLPGAREQLVQLDRRGVEVLVWSAGEPKHQHHKLAAIGIADPHIAPTVDPPVEVSHDFGEPLHVTTAIAPDKTVPQNMDKVAEAARDRHLVVVDDRTKNLQAFQAHFPEATALWVQFGAHAGKSVARLDRGEDPAVAEAIARGTIVPVRDIADLVPTIERLQREGMLPADNTLALATDLDDTLLDNDRRRDLQHAASKAALQEHGWTADPSTDQATTAPDTDLVHAALLGLPPVAATKSTPHAEPHADPGSATTTGLHVGSQHERDFGQEAEH